MSASLAWPETTRVQIVEQQDAGRDAEHDAGEIEDAERQAGRGRAVVELMMVWRQLPESSSQSANSIRQ